MSLGSPANWFSMGARMRSPWTRRNQFGTIAGELANSQDREFERRVLSYARLVWPEARQSPPRQQLDQAGIDLYVGEPPHFSVVIQCKGFLERDLLADQLRQCLESLSAFGASRYTADRFILLYNRSGDTRSFEAALSAPLAAVQRKAPRADLWTHRALLIAAFDAMSDRVRTALRNRTRALQREQALVERTIGAEPLTRVPLAAYELRIDKTRLRSTSARKVVVGDPLAYLFDPRKRRVSVLLGRAGYGKTTAAMRTLTERSETCIVIPAARIKGDVSNAHTLLETALG